MQNYDELILRSRTVQANAPFPAAHQAARIALYDEYAARSFYASVLEAYGTRAPFPLLARTQQERIEALGQLCERLGCARPLDPYPTQTTLAPGWRANCERAAIGKITNIQLYGQLLPYAVDKEMLQVLLRLQAAAREQHLPALRHAAAEAMALEQYHARHGITPAHAHARHGAVTDFLERAFAQLGPHAGPLGLLSPLIRSAHPALLAGVAAGAAGVYLYRHQSGHSHEEN